jgi:uncharacterized protein
LGLANAAFLLGFVAALVASPLLYTLTHDRPRAARALDLFILVSMTALIVVEVAPETLEHGGTASIAFFLAGLIGPTLLERGFRRARREAHIGALALAMAGMMLHTLADGVVLAADLSAPGAWALPLAVVLHSVPVGLAVWWLLAPAFGPRWPATVLGLMVVGTLVGFVFGAGLERILDAQAWAWLQALVAGSILHVVFGRPHLAHGHS